MAPDDATAEFLRQMAESGTVSQRAPRGRAIDLDADVDDAGYLITCPA